MTRIKSAETLNEIGGYFGLELPDYGDLYPDSIKFQSARAAIRAALECNGITHVMMPAYLCESINKAAVDAGMTVETYELNEYLYPKNLPDRLPEHCAFIYVNYFGLCTKNVLRLHEEIPNDHLIIDNSHALFAPHMGALASIYSPRKFAGLPDGGLLVASAALKITPPEKEDSLSIERMRYLLIRMANSAREGYADFQTARNSFQDSEPLSMSRLTQRLIKSIRWDQVMRRRKENYSLVARMMDKINDMHWVMESVDVPLCYPLTVRGYNFEKIKAELAENGIFIATYWLDARSKVSTDSIEAAMINETLCIPVDQRMEYAQVEKVVRLVLRLMNGSAH